MELSKSHQPGARESHAMRAREKPLDVRRGFPYRGRAHRLRRRGATTRKTAHRFFIAFSTPTFMSSRFIAGQNSMEAWRFMKNGSATVGIIVGSLRSKKKYAV